MGRMYTGGTTSPAPSVSAGSSSSFSDGFGYGISLPQYNSISSTDGAFTGTLSAQGNMVAMQLNPGGPKLVYVGQQYSDGGLVDVYQRVPYLTGYAREYWRDPGSCTFGANSAIPALTGVMPARFTALQGSAIYYIDLQLSRISGSNFFDNFSFINNFNKALNWVVASNGYIAALKKAEEQNLAYFGAKSYQELTTQGFSNYKIGTALRTSLINLGSLVKEIPNGHFGTVNSVAKFMIDSGLGAVGNLSAGLIAQGVNLADIYNDIYTAQISSVLSSITAAADLSLIQEVIGSNVSNMSSPVDYTDLVKTSAQPNDSAFQSLAEFGKNIYDRAPNLNVTTGQELVDLIDAVLAQAGASVEALATPTGILPQDIINGLRRYLPFSPNNSPVSILNIVGCASGYLIDQLTEVNQEIDKLDKSDYGTQLRSLYRQINKTYIAFSAAYSGGSDAEGNALPPSPNYLNLERQLGNLTNSYLTLTNQIANDPQLASAVQNLNAKYDQLCESLYYEVRNYNKANIAPSTYYDNTIISGFVSSLPSYAADTQGLSTDYFLYGMCQDNQAGDIVRTLLNQNKNNSILANAGVRITGII